MFFYPVPFTSALGIARGGTVQSHECDLHQVLQEAVQRNDEYKVYCQMAAIFANSNKTDEALKIYKILLKKFAKEKDIWIRYRTYLR